MDDKVMRVVKVVLYSHHFILTHVVLGGLS